MKSKILGLLFALVSTANILAASDSTYYLIIGDKKCPLIFHERLDSTTVFVKLFPNPTSELLTELKNRKWDAHVFVPGSLDTVFDINPVTIEDEVIIIKDTVKEVRYLVEKVASQKTFAYGRKTMRVDTVMQVDPVSLGEQQVVIPNHRFDIKNDLGNVNFNLFMKQVKAGFIITNGTHILHTSEIYFYYETPADYGYITLKYPNPDSALLKKLSVLSNGGFVYIFGITTDSFLTEVIYLETYFSVNNTSARPQATKNLSSITRIPYTLPFQDSVVALYYSTSNRVLYTGIENRLTITISGLPPANVRAYAEGDVTITQSIADPKVFSIVAKQPVPAIIHFSGIINGTYKEISIDTFTVVKRIAYPMPLLNGKLGGGYVSKESLQAMSGVVVFNRDYYIPERFTVVGFDMLYSSKGRILTSHANGPLFNPEMSEWINQSKKDDIFIIQAIHVIGFDGRPLYWIPSMTFILAYE